MVQELLDLAPTTTLEVSRQDAALVEVLVAAGFRESDGPWFAQLWKDLRDAADLARDVLSPG